MCSQEVTLFKALADENRLNIIRLLRCGACSTECVKITFNAVERFVCDRLAVFIDRRNFCAFFLYEFIGRDLVHKILRGCDRIGRNLPDRNRILRFFRSRQNHQTAQNKRADRAQQAQNILF